MDPFFAKTPGGTAYLQETAQWATGEELWAVALRYVKATMRAPFFKADTYTIEGGVTLDLAGRQPPAGYQQYLDSLKGASASTNLDSL
jgi:hypothetical protein